MLINKAVFSRMLLKVAEVWKENIPRLSDIDSRFGDGDHGITIGKIAGLLETSVQNWQGDNFRSFIEGLGESIMGISGGSAGPLYGTLVGGLAEPLQDETEIDAKTLKKMLNASREAMCDISKARVGDKTMMDALMPAVEAAQKAPDDTMAVLAAAAGAAQKGAEATRNFVSRYGRARSYGEQTLGVVDAGAMSTALLFQGLCEGY